jgi:hypothetical protein
VRCGSADGSICELLSQVVPQNGPHVFFRHASAGRISAVRYKTTHFADPRSVHFPAGGPTSISHSRGVPGSSGAGHRRDVQMLASDKLRGETLDREALFHDPKPTLTIARCSA